MPKRKFGTLKNLGSWSNYNDSSDILARFSARSCCFMDAYEKGLNGKQAAWASKKFRGHRVLPESIFCDLNEPNIV